MSIFLFLACRSVYLQKNRLPLIGYFHFHFFFAWRRKTKDTRQSKSGIPVLSLLLKWLELLFKYDVHWDNHRMAIICPDVLDISSTTRVCLRMGLLSWNSSVGKDRFRQIHHFHCCSNRCSDSTRHSNACSPDGWMPMNDESRLFKGKRTSNRRRFQQNKQWKDNYSGRLTNDNE